MGRLQLSVGVCAYNEAKNLEAIVSQLLSQRLDNAVLKELIIVSSGSTDGTDAIARRLAARDSRVVFLRERKRKGKVSAVNKVLGRARGDIVVLSGADLRLEDDTLDRMVAGFSNENVGMVGARPVPVNDKGTLFGFCSHLIWKMHHTISLTSPKCGEFVAIRNNGYIIPKGTTVDEAYLEWAFRKDGYSLAYAPDAIVRNRGPENLRDYIAQRRRIHAHHLQLRSSTGYGVSTTDSAAVLKAFLSTLEPDPKKLIFSGIGVALEGVSSLLGAYDVYIRNDGHQCWEVAASTKEI